MCCRRRSGKQSRQAKEYSSRSAARRSGRSSLGGTRNSRPLAVLKRSWQSGRKRTLLKTTAMCPQHGARQSDLSLISMQFEVLLWRARHYFCSVVLPCVMGDTSVHNIVLHNIGFNNVRLSLMIGAELFSKRYPTYSASQTSSSARARLRVAVNACCASGPLPPAA